jgi:hypothetical protein
MLVAMMLTPSTLSHLLWSLPCLFWLQILMSSTRASLTTRLLSGRFKCGNITYFIVDCPKRKKFESSNKFDYTNRNDNNNKSDHKKKNRFKEKKKKKKFQKIMS